MSSQPSLEHSYEQLLRFYPASWRVRHGDELIGVMLDVAHSQGRTRASFSDWWDAAVHGMALRVSRVLHKIPRVRRDRLAATGVFVGTSCALVMMGLGEIGRWFRWNSYTLLDQPFGPFTTPASVVFLLVIAGFLAVLFGRQHLAKALHGLAFICCVTLFIILSTTELAIPISRFVPVAFAFTSVLSLLGNPTRTTLMSKTVLLGAPLTGVVLTLTSYLQNGGSQRTFHGGWEGAINDSMIAYSTLQLAGIATLLILSSHRVLPLASLLLVSAAAIPVTRLFYMLGGDPMIGLIGIQPSTFQIGFCIVAINAAWIAWKRPTITSPTKSGHSAQIS